MIGYFQKTFTTNAPASVIPLIGYHRIFRYLKKMMKRTFELSPQFMQPIYNMLPYEKVWIE